MSMRTIFEINHDYGHVIKDDPEAFADALRRYLNSGSKDEALPLERFGLRVAWFGHHSADRKVVAPHFEKKL